MARGLLGGGTMVPTEESTAPDLTAFVHQVLEIAVSVKARDLRRRACSATLPSLQAQAIRATPSRLPPPKPARRSEPDSGRYSYVLSRHTT